jgi:hypothetical protein
MNRKVHSLAQPSAASTGRAAEQAKKKKKNSRIIEAHTPEFRAR